MSKYVIDGGDWIALRADDTEEEGSEFVGVYPEDYLSEENFDGYKRVDNYLMDSHTGRGEYRVCVIRREADGATFGFQYFRSGGKHGEDYVESNEWEHHDKLADAESMDEGEWFVFLPVEPHAIPTYKFREAAK